MQFIKVEKNVEDRVAILTFNRPEVYNAFHSGIIGEVTAALADLSADDSIRCVVITGEGKAFCAGADLGDFDGVGGDPTGVTPGTNTSWAMLQRWNPEL